METKKVNNLTTVTTTVGSFQIADIRETSRTAKPYILQGQNGYRSMKQAIAAGVEMLANELMNTKNDFSEKEVNFLSRYFNGKYSTTTVHCSMNYSTEGMKFVAVAAKLNGCYDVVLFEKETKF